MTDLRQAAQQALEALESGLAFHTNSEVLQNLRAALAEETLQRLTDVHQEIGAALEQPDRQPLQAAGTHPAPCARHCEAKAFEIEIRSLKSALRDALEQQAEPSKWRDMVVVNLVREGINKHKARELADHFGTPPQRKPLTNAEIIAVAKQTKSAEPGLDGYILPVSFARAIEAAHGIKEGT